MKDRKFTISQDQMISLMETTLRSFKENGIRQCIKDEHKWWADNILNGVVPRRVDRLENTTFFVYF